MKINVSLEVTPEQLAKIAAVMTETQMNEHVQPTPASTPAPIIPAAQIATAAAAQMFPRPAPTAPPAAAPIPTQPPIPTQTAPQTYTVQELGLAARPLVEMGRQQELVNLLAEFGAPSVAELPENSRAAFAAKLRTMGGQI